ncbi:MAG: DUF1330 domain-containing protein [Pseudomonadota bacterium]
MPAYIIVDTQIENAEEYEAYKAKARPLAESFGGEYLARGGEMAVLEDDLWTPTRIVIVKFPDLAAAKAFHASEAYAPVKALRRANAKCTLIAVDGI